MGVEERTRRLVRIFAKIPMFQGLSTHRALEILKICRLRAFRRSDVVCEAGSKSTEMFILVAGSLGVYSEDKVQLAHLTPITTVGEMGMMTGQPRSATVLAMEATTVFEINRLKFEVMLKKHPDIGFTVYQNTIHTLSDRLARTSADLAEAERQRKLSGASMELVA